MMILADPQSGVAPEYAELVKGEPSQLSSLNTDGVTNTVIATEHEFSDKDISVLMKLRASGASVHNLTAIYEEYQSKVPILHLKHGWFINSSGFYLLQNATGLKIKRLLDLLFSVLLLVLTLPLTLLVALLIKLDSPGPVFYAQSRYGLNSCTFQVLKFRSMIADAEKDGARWAETDDPRITRVGRIIRKMRIDEIPQLWNVMKGDMSFIGPRPERPEFISMLEKEIPFYELRHLIKPGITGWAQVMYPYGSSIEDAIQKLQYDLYYIKNYTVLLDFVILMKTLRIIIWQKGR
jgi:exopolysaccharide biosynthesis polyprenyl glycosylphosphotransferase